MLSSIKISNSKFKSALRKFLFINLGDEPYITYLATFAKMNLM